MDSDGLIVHQILPRGANALNPLPANSPFMQPPTANVIAGWNFNSPQRNSAHPGASTNNSSGTPAASALGMTNSYTYSTSPVTVGSTNGDDVTGTTLSSDPLMCCTAGQNNIAPNDNNAWRVRGAGSR